MRSEDSVSKNVSRETTERLQEFEKLVREWTSKINLVAPSTLEHFWTRHIDDSAQLVDLAGYDAGKWVDIGSGGGLPGIVAAIMMKDVSPNTRFVLIESDKRKSVFLKTVTRNLSLSVDVISKRIEETEAQQADVLSARALASLDKLLGYAETHLKPDGCALFLKGKNWEKEHEEAMSKWRFSCDVIQSTTESEAAILQVKNIQRK